GANGTYIDGERISKITAVNGMIIRLASSGPKISIEINSNNLESDPAIEQNLLSAKRLDRLKDTKRTLISGD
ncbi:MAG: FHA domain-containing protein, partial [Xenococcaceae cyanobacterium]